MQLFFNGNSNLTKEKDVKKTDGPNKQFSKRSDRFDFMKYADEIPVISEICEKQMIRYCPKCKKGGRK